MNAWFESVAEAHRRARRRLPDSVYRALVAGAEKGVTLVDNVRAFEEIALVPRAADLPGERNLSTTVMGQEVALPVLVAPTGVQAVHPDGEVAVAAAAAEAGTVMCLSSFASKPVEQVVAANAKTFFQTYWVGTRDEIAARIDRAWQAGARGLILTLDWSFSTGRDWGSPPLPEHMNARTALRFLPEGIRRPRYVWQYLRHGGLPELTVPNIGRVGESHPTFFAAYGQWMQTPLPTWDDLAWVRAQWPGPLMLKGITHPDDARRAVDIGADAISVSNHGGNNLDSVPATIRALPGVVEAVGDEVEVLLDGGIRRGSDAVKAIALGARAVLVGRAVLWGLAANGQAGVKNVFDILRDDIDSALLGLGAANVRDLRSANVRLPSDFTNTPRPLQHAPLTEPLQHTSW